MPFNHREAYQHAGPLSSQFGYLFMTTCTKRRAEITHKMERILLQDVPGDRGFYWKSAMAYWNRVKHWPPLQGTTVYNFGKFEQVWCQGGKCM
jgi:hypothetical protein